MKIKRIITITAIAFAFSNSIFSQVGIGTTTPNASAELDVTSTNKGLLPPRMTQAQRNAIATPAAGLMVWCTNCGSAGELQVYNGTTWTNMVGGSASISTDGIVLVAPGVSKQFLSHNLGADTSLDPHTPVVGLQGAYIQWGRRGPNTTGNSSVDWQTAANTANFAAAPTSGSANHAAISGWSTTAAANGSWGATKTVNDPCPTGYRVPTNAEWIGVNSNNTQSRTGTFASGSTQYGSALHYGPNASTKLLTLPVAGLRGGGGGDGSLGSRGAEGFYWSSTEDGDRAFYVYFNSSATDPSSGMGNRTGGMSLRCIAE